MRFKNITREESSEKIKLSSHKDGKSGFSSDAVEKLQLDANMYVQFGIDEDNPKEENLLMRIFNKKVPQALKINKNGKYFSVKTKQLFQDIGLDFKNKKFIFDLEEKTFEGNIYYKLNKREVGQRKKSK
jgi:hypothetical protein